MSIIAHNPDTMFWETQETRLAEKFGKHLVRTGPICTTTTQVDDLNDRLPLTPEEKDLEATLKELENK